MSSPEASRQIGCRDRIGIGVARWWRVEGGGWRGEEEGGREGLAESLGSTLNRGHRLPVGLRRRTLAKSKSRPQIVA